ncbi:nucleoside recognition domain-containing protein [Sedimentibacter sp.]|uniref:nucleoside recognition domain-containing protein n=1 Tax=Sedimentibacter sp. TaxID=1960295 RepID=UPI0028970E26|nr:nucleoside recognition domain-containing protein [Sedimentibacter sp.]
MITMDTFKRGLTNGITTLLELLKILVPVYAGVQILALTGFLSVIAKVFEPIMSIFGLPGEASLILILSYFSGQYAALGGLAALDLSGFQITTIAIMCAIAHSLITESAVVKKLGVSTIASISVRLFFSTLMGFLFYRIFG